MNSMVSATVLATATAVDTPSIANAALILGEVSFPALVDRFVRIRERRDAQEDKDKAWAEKIDRLMSDGTDLSREELSKIVDQNPPEDMDAKGRSIAWPKISGELNSVAKAMLRRKPQSIADLAWQAEAVLTADDELCGENEEHPLLPRLLENIRSLAGPLSIPRIALAADTVDPIFAAIDAHRSAYDELDKAVKAADVSPVHRTATLSARVMVGLKDGTESSWTETGGGGFTLIVTPTGRKEPIYASCSAQIWENVPKELQGDARLAWIADREAELEAAEQRIAKRRSRTKIGKLEADRDKAYDLERDRLWDMIWTMPTTVEGLATLLRYCRERESINELVADEAWEDALEWTMERAACALAGLPEPAMSKVVTSLREAADVRAEATT